MWIVEDCGGLGTVLGAAKIEAMKFGLSAGLSMDLTSGWDFSKAEDRRRAEDYLEEVQPLLVIGSPEC